MKLSLFPRCRRRGRRFISSLFTSFLCSFIFYMIFRLSDHITLVAKTLTADYYQRPGCTCSRPGLPSLSAHLLLNEQQPSFCSHYASQRGPHQRIISISLFGVEKNQKFEIYRSLYYLHLFINDINRIYSDEFILRIYHDASINLTDVICPIECKYSNVDFCNTTQQTFIPPKIWRFIPAGDPSVDIMLSRDLDSALTERERAAVDVWLTSNKLFHVMRDHPQHASPMLGGMWGFRPSLNPDISRVVYNHIHNQELVKRYGGTADQQFLTAYVWPLAQSSAVVHDSFLCKQGYGYKSEPFPTRRPSANETNCFVGCSRSSCAGGKLPFGECPKECRPKDHPDWIYC